MASDSESSSSLFDRALRVMPGGNTRTTTFMEPHPPYALRGRGAFITDVEGSERLDFVNNYTSLIHGHAHPKIVSAVAEQLELGSCFPFPTELEITLAECLCSRVGSVEHIRFTNSGTEAVMMAIKAARAYTGKHKIAKCEGAYHGSYDPVTVSLDPNPTNWGDTEPVPVAYSPDTASDLDDVIVLPFNDPDTAERLLVQHQDDLAAVIVDPLPHRVGFIRAADPFLRMLRNFTRKNQSILIFDEVMTFRLGYHGAQAEFGIIPDLTTMGKIIGGGFPVGALGGKAEVMSVFDPRGEPILPHAGTFNANPISMAAGLASMRMMDTDSFARLNALGTAIRRRITETFRDADVPAQVCGGGSLFRLHLTDRPLMGYRDAYARGVEKDRLTRLHRYFFDHGVLIAPNGMGCLSTAMSESSVEEYVSVLSDSLQHVFHDH